MKKAIKYLVLSASSIICFGLFVVMVSLLIDIGSLSYPATLILPLVSYSLFISGLIVLTIWAFKFSSEKVHKTFLFISLGLLIASIGVYHSAKIVNPIISEKPKEESVVFFDFTKTEFVSGLSDWGITLTPFADLNDEENNGKIATYTFSTENDTLDTMMHYQVHYNEDTERVSYISFSFDKNFMGELSSARTRFRYHISTIAQIITPSADIDEIYEKISTVTGDGAGMSVYQTEEFSLFASCTDTYFSASFRPLM